MLSIFRKGVTAKIFLGLLGLVLLAFIATGVTDHGMFSGTGATSEQVATVGGEPVHSAEVATRVQLQLNQARQEQPGLDINAFARAGGVEQTVDQIIAARAMTVWGGREGIVASQRLIDGEIASIPAFKGPTGQFDQTTFRSALAQQRITEKQLRDDIASEIIRRQLLVPVAAAARVPAALVKPYADLLLEAREGQIGIVPVALMPPGKAPTEAEIADYYNRNIAAYTLGERRQIRYALFGHAEAGAGVKPTEAEIAAFYKANAATYAAKEARAFSQVILPDEAAAKAFAAKVKGGTPFAQAAQQAGFSPSDTNIGEQSREKLAALASSAVSAAAYAAPANGVTDPVKSELGWHIVHVDAIKGTPARPLEAVRGEIEASLAKQKADEALSAKVTAIEDKIADGSSFDEVVKDQKLTAVTTPPLLPNGSAPDLPGWQPAPEMAVLLKAAFEASPDEDPTVETIGAGQRFALLDLQNVVPSAPVPLAKVRDRVLHDLTQKRALDRARAVAAAIVAKTDAGTPLAKAIAESGIPLPPPQRAGGRQMDIAQSGRPVPPPLAMMFSMAAGKTKLMAAPGGQGWFVVHLDKIIAGDAAKAPGLVDATRGEFTRVVGSELLDQFTKAVAKDVGVERNAAAIARVKKQLTGGQTGLP